MECFHWPAWGSVWLCSLPTPALLHSCSLAEYEKLEKVLDYIATTENINVMNILPVLNAKHGSCWEEN